MEDNLKNEIIEVSTKIYQFSELGSEERRSSEFLVNMLKSHGFKVEYPYLGMETAFRAEWGEGKPSVGLLAEYDALPNSHSCGHNLIAAWAYGTAVLLSKELKRGKVVVFGTPDEEAFGKYAGSKAVFVEKGAFTDIDFVIGVHPMDKWSVGGKTFAEISFQAIFKGKASHALNLPEKGINALDALVSSYVAINNMRSWITYDKHAIISMVIKEGGKISSIVPDRAVLEIDLETSSKEFLKSLENKVLSILQGVSQAYGTGLEIEYLQPIYENYNPNKFIDEVMENYLKEVGIEVLNQDKENPLIFSVTDEANVSKVVPTGHLDIGIGYPGIPLHSDDFREAANPQKAGGSLITGIIVAARSIEKIFSDKELLKKIRITFEQSIR